MSRVTRELTSSMIPKKLLHRSKRLIELSDKILSKYRIEPITAHVKKLTQEVDYLRDILKNLSGCSEHYCCHAVHMNGFSHKMCKTCNCCYDKIETERREEDQRIVEREFLEAERGNLYDEYDDLEECPSEISASSVDLDDLEPEPIKKPVKRPFKKVELESESEPELVSDEDDPEPEPEPIKQRVVIHRKYKSDLMVPVEEKNKVCTCPADEEDVVYCKGCEASKRPVPKKYVRK